MTSVRRLSNMTFTHRTPFILPPNTSELPPALSESLTPRDLPPTLTVMQAAKILGCGRSLAYDLIRRNEFPSPVVRLGNRRYVIPTAALLRVVGIDALAPDRPDS